MREHELIALLQHLFHLAIRLPHHAQARRELDAAAARPLVAEVGVQGIDCGTKVCNLPLRDG